MSHTLAGKLLQIGAVQINVEQPFIWTSGIESPIYCDNRLTMSYPEIRTQIAEFFIDKIKAMDEDVDVIAGCATAGIPHAAFVADRLNLPMVYVRSSAKKHGKQNQIEGTFARGEKVVLIEDLVSTGQSSLHAAHAIRDAGGEVLQVLSIFSYGLNRAHQAFQEASYPFTSLFDLNELMTMMKRENQLSSQDETKLQEWLENQ
ncbi:orotate phosphoribosyltransferase [Thalassobacillus sp. CUG 92003]|uniref:orotate phosphoribosyltransferase n=1 Tax=Thalassobacillus sp. CUG 92003 TaxID=2736641 RepID=UPI0015E707B3|nr:orotate phosphoribosyltransferase [Thalassobacillus sp. CUG 92003]